METVQNTIIIPQNALKEMRWHLKNYNKLDEHIEKRRKEIREELSDYYHYTNKNFTLYGMDSEIGPISFNGLNPTEIGIFGEKTLSDIGSKISKILKEAESKAKDILQRNHKILLAVTDELLEKETISGEDLDVIFRKFASKSDA